VTDGRAGRVEATSKDVEARRLRIGIGPGDDEVSVLTEGDSGIDLSAQSFRVDPELLTNRALRSSGRQSQSDKDRNERLAVHRNLRSHRAGLVVLPIDTRTTAEHATVARTWRAPHLVTR